MQSGLLVIYGNLLGTITVQTIHIMSVFFKQFLCKAIVKVPVFFFQHDVNKILNVLFNTKLMKSMSMIRPNDQTANHLFDVVFLGK